MPVNPVLLPPSAVAQHRPAIEKMGRRYNHPDLAEQIENACHEKQAFFFGFDFGFCVLRPDPGALLVWVAHAWAPVDWPAAVACVEGLAREVGLNKLEFIAVRPGFKRWRLGFTPEPVITDAGLTATRWSKRLEF